MTEEHREGHPRTSIFEVRPPRPEDEPAVAAFIEQPRCTWIHPDERIRELAGTPSEKLVAINRVSGERVGLLACAQIAGPGRLMWIRDLRVVPTQPWELVAGALLDALVPERSYEVILRESDTKGKELFRSRGYTDYHRADQVWPDAFDAEAGVVMRRFGNEYDRQVRAVFLALKRLLATCGRRASVGESELSGIFVEWWAPNGEARVARADYPSAGRATRTQVTFFLSYDDGDARELRHMGDLLDDSEHDDDAYLDGT